jgi:hypothetical protein
VFSSLAKNHISQQFFLAAMTLYSLGSLSYLLSQLNQLSNGGNNTGYKVSIVRLHRLASRLLLAAATLGAWPQG